MTLEIFSIASFTVAMALLATLLMLPPGVALAWLLARRPFPGRSVLDTLVSLPLVLPPVATGLILLWLLGRRGPLGELLARVGFDVLFTWKAVVIAMAVMGLPLLVNLSPITDVWLARIIFGFLKDTWRSSMKFGDLVRHVGQSTKVDIGVVLYNNDKGGTLKILCQHTGKVWWVVKSQCEVLNESR